MPKSTLPPAVKSGILADLAATPKGTQHGIQDICQNWGVRDHIVQYLQRTENVEINALRKANAERCGVLGFRLGDRIMEDLNNEKVMKETPFRDKALALNKIVQAGVMAEEGIVQNVEINIQQIKIANNILQNFDATVKQAKAKVVDVLQ